MRPLSDLTFSFAKHQDVLIAFMPFLKGSHSEATRIHEEYQASSDQKAFLKAARSFLSQSNDTSTGAPNAILPSSTNPTFSSTKSTASNSNIQQTSLALPLNTPLPVASMMKTTSQLAPPQTPPRNHASAQETVSSLRLIDVPPPAQNGANEPFGSVGQLVLNNMEQKVVVPSIPAASASTSIWGGAPANPWPEAATTPPRSTAKAPTTTTTPTRPKKEAPQPKRIWTRFHQQPGRLSVNNVGGDDFHRVLEFSPRSELFADWSLPIESLRQHQVDPGDSSLDRALEGLTVGLFRRGCTENGQQASIISKAILSYDYWHDPNAKCIRGKVPFYSPRTPGNVLFRLYWENHPLETLAIGPTLRVRVSERDFESSVRFILGNFRGRKSNPTSLSSLHSLAMVLETPLPASRHNESSSSRAVWGCVQESRKVIEVCYEEYIKTSSKMSNLEGQIENLKEQLSSSEGEDDEDAKKATETLLQDKIRSLMSGRASCERKWRDSQLAFSNILKSLLSTHSLLRREQMTRIRLEYELWCPLSEEFANPSESAGTWLECVSELPTMVTADHFAEYRSARQKMQVRTLGFALNTTSLVDVVFPATTGQRTLNSQAVGVLNTISSAMGQFYQELFFDEERVVKRRDLIRRRCEQLVNESTVFPIGTEVVIFGSSANGFGSPQSDMDMCLQLPASFGTMEDGQGSECMARLAEHLDESGMEDVDTSRLGARIPIIKFNCPDPLHDGSSDEPSLIECDISMQNPLAVLNTSLLRSYAEINPVTRVLASIVKRWAKARDINSPERHTLSSYGYVIMLLHFLTYHRRTENGLVAPIAPAEGDPRIRNQGASQPTPLLPNLQWVEQSWPSTPRGTPYRENVAMPQRTMKHPMKENSVVNTHFYKPNTNNDKAAMQQHFPGHDLSLSILLASFFRYYAFDFDFKRHVVSLHSIGSRGLEEREVKAELDGWRNYSAALAIEDPFELDYDVAHVLRGGYYHRIRREFALAYTKMVEAGLGNSWKNVGDLKVLSGKDLVNWICEPVSAEKEQGSTGVAKGANTANTA